MGHAPQRTARLHFRAPGNARQNETGSRSFERRQARAFGGRESVALGITGSISGGKRPAAKCRDLTGNVTHSQRSRFARRFTNQTSRRQLSRALDITGCFSGGKRRDLTGNFTRCFPGRERSNVPRRFIDQTSRRHFTRAGNRRSWGSAFGFREPSGNHRDDRSSAFAFSKRGDSRRDDCGDGGQFDRHAAAILRCLAPSSSL
jgi:hypothetical protein